MEGCEKVVDLAFMVFYCVFLWCITDRLLFFLYIYIYIYKTKFEQTASWKHKSLGCFFFFGVVLFESKKNINFRDADESSNFNGNQKVKIITPGMTDLCPSEVK